MLKTPNRRAGRTSCLAKLRSTRFPAKALFSAFIATAAACPAIAVPASAISSPGPLCGRMQGYTPQVNVRCADGISLTHVLAIPGTSHEPRPLLAGVVWAGRDGILAITYTHLLQWKFSAGKAECTATALGSKVGHQRIGLFARHQGAVLVSACGPTTGHKPALILSRISAGALALRQWLRLSGEASGIRVGPGGRVDFPRVIFPAAGDWIGTVPYDAVPGDRLVIRRIGRGAAPAETHRLFETRNIGFAAADGKSFGWVSLGHWVRLLAMGNGSGVVARIHVTGPDIQYGALSPRGRQLALIAYGPSTLLGSQTILELLRANNPSQEKLLQLSNGYTTNMAPACPPVFSPDGRLVAAATLRRTSHFPDEVLIVDAGSPGIYCKARFGMDAPISLAFSPGGRQLAIECWYRIFVFKLPKGFPPQRGATPGAGRNRAFLHRVETVTIPQK